MTSPLKHSRILLAALLLLVCALVVVACGSSSPSSSTSAAVAGTTTGAATAGTTGTTGTTGSGATGATTGSPSTGTTGSSKAHHPKRRRELSIAKGSSPTPKRRVQASAVRRCLEKAGVKTQASGSTGSTRAQLQAALAKCDPGLAPKRRSGQEKAVRRELLSKPAYRAALARFTSCMRKHGVPNFPEANTTGNGPLYPANSVKSTPQVRTAQRACISALKLF